MTAEEYASLPQADNGTKDELYLGSVVKQPLPRPLHGFCCARVVKRVGEHVDRLALGHTTAGSGVIVTRDPDSVFAPDLAYWSRATLPVLPARWPEMPPELVVEVCDGPGDYKGHIMYKVPLYLAFGVQLIWVIIPQWAKIEVHRLRDQPCPFVEMEWRSSGWRRLTSLWDSDTLSGEDVLPGFSCRVADLLP